jgi:hypothetical protein
MIDLSLKQESKTKKHKKQVKRITGRLTLWRKTKKSAPVELPNLLGELLPQL